VRLQPANEMAEAGSNLKQTRAGAAEAAGEDGVEAIGPPVLAEPGEGDLVVRAGREVVLVEGHEGWLERASALQPLRRRAT